jgi:hypothetical protein
MERRRAAFSLIELLTAVSIMILIIFSLYSMFSQTQKALRANVTQVDVLESGRAAAEMLGREIEQLSACNQFQTINFYAGMMPYGSTAVVAPTVQLDLDGKVPPLRTNVLEELYFLSRQTNRWVGTGYRVMGANNGVGTLYRFTESTNYYRLTPTNLWAQYLYGGVTNAVTGQVSTNFNRVADGVVHLRITAYDPDGRQMLAYSTNRYGSYRILSQDVNGGRLGAYSTAVNLADANVVLRQQFGQETALTFMSNAVPGYVELELGVLEPVALKQYQSLSVNAGAAFLKQQSAKVHLFRQRIPIRTVVQ